MRVPKADTKPRRNFRATDWKEFKNLLVTTLANAPRPARIHTPEEFRSALDMINRALKTTVKAKVPENKMAPHTKHWWSHELMVACKRKQRLANLAYKWRGLPDHYAHKDHRQASKDYVNLIEKSKKSHWETWLLAAADRDLWTANKYATGPPTDGGKTRMPTLRKANGDGTHRQAMSNEDKTEALAKSLSPPPPPLPIVLDICYPRPADEHFHFFTRAQIKQAAAKLDVYKAPGPDRIPNVVLKQCTDELADHLYFIFRAIFKLKVYPNEWRESITCEPSNVRLCRSVSAG